MCSRVSGYFWRVVVIDKNLVYPIYRVPSVLAVVVRRGAFSGVGGVGFTGVDEEGAA
jgi:hypothetical protein